jgi:serine/threonine protein phosphatase PrpC
MIRAPARTGMGTTIAGLGVTADSVVVFNVGDSRIYRMSERRLEQISIDDSEEIMTSFASVAFPARALSQCLGGFPGEGSIKPHFLREQPVEECAYLLCSDGLHDMLSDGEIAQCLSADLEESVRNLFEGAMNAGGIDNISIIIARVEGGAPA